MDHRALYCGGLFYLLLFLPGLCPAQTDLYDPDRVIDVRLYTEAENWQWVLDSLKASDEGRLTCDAEINGKRYEGVGLRYKGNSSFHAPKRRGKEKLPFNIKIDHRLKSQRLPGGYTRLKLSNSFRDPSFLREVLAYEIAGRYMPAPKANFARVYINEQYLGLYQSTESIDDRFLDQHYGDHDGQLTKCDPLWNAVRPPDCPNVKPRSNLKYLGDNKACYVGLYEPKTDSVWDGLLELTRRLEQDPEGIESILNINQTLWMLAFNNVLVNLDSYLGEFCHNYYLYQDTLGYFHPLIWDMNMAFGGFRLDGLGHTLKLEEMQQLSMFVHYKQSNAERPLITQLLRVDHYRKRYLACVRTLLEEVFLSGWFEQRARQLHEEMTDYVLEDANKLYDDEGFYRNLESTVSAGKEEIVGILELMGGRMEYLANHPLLQKTPPALADARVETLPPGKLLFTVAAPAADQVWLMVRPKDRQSHFDRLAMHDDGSQNDYDPGDGTWGLEIPNSGDLDYYFVAEDEYQAAFHPSPSGKRYFTVSRELKKK